jgi:hypothetical protein
MNAFQTISLAAVGATLAALAVHFAVAGRRAAFGRPRTRLGPWQRLVYGVTLAALAVLAATGLWAALRAERLSGWLLLVHNAAAGPFALGLVVLAVLWAERCRFAAGPAPALFAPAQRAVFWAAAVLAAALILSMMLCWVRLFGTDGQEFLLEVHRYAALGMIATGLVHLYLIALARRSA